MRLDFVEQSIKSTVLWTDLTSDEQHLLDTVQDRRGWLTTQGDLSWEPTICMPVDDIMHDLIDCLLEECCDLKDE